MNNKITIGSRGSKLSLAYTNKVRSLISSFDPNKEKQITIETITERIYLSASCTKFRFLGINNFG